MEHPHPSRLRSRGQRLLWLAAGVLSLVVGVVGIFLPLLPTTPLVLLAAFCFSRGSERWEAWMLAHPRFGPMVHDWRRNRAVPLRAKQLATVMMAVSSIGTWWVIQSPWRWAPGLCCLAVALWLWSLPTAVPASIDE
ncbi:MAG: YbaN family protein [Rhizobacter sp.]|nr:YbaN family protein [Rhizobacter sp.]